jgi:hypothetical protein
VPALEKELAPFKGQYDLLICLTNLPGLDIMSMMGMGAKQPVPLSKLSIWKERDVKVVLAEGGINKFGGMIQSGKIPAAVAYKQNIPETAYETMPPKELDAAFDMRYVLVTTETIGQFRSYFGR